MARPVLSRNTRQLLIDEQIKIYAFFGIKTAAEGPFFFAAVWPAQEQTPIFAEGLTYFHVEADTPEECVEKYRQKLWQGL